MKITRTVGLAAAALAVAGFAGSASAADLDKGHFGHGNGRAARAAAAAAPAHSAAHADGYQWGAHAARGPAGPCYFRADLGYSVSKDPDVKFPISNGRLRYTGTAAQGSYNATNNTFTQAAAGYASLAALQGLFVRDYIYAGEDTSAVSLENSWMGGVGAGCGTGAWGIRGEMMLDFRGARKLDAEPGFFSNGAPLPTVIAPAPVPVPVVLAPPAPAVDPLHTTVRTTTAMVNAYKDFGNFGGFMPYVGAGVGVAYNQVGETFFTGNPNLVNRIEGASKLSLAWSLMAGIGWQVSDRAILDFGYRYIDMGNARSGRVDSAGFVNPAVRIDDLAAHEFKIGLRYHFGDSCCQQVSYAPVQPLK